MSNYATYSYILLAHDTHTLPEHMPQCLSFAIFKNPRIFRVPNIENATTVTIRHAINLVHIPELPSCKRFELYGISKITQLPALNKCQSLILQGYEGSIGALPDIKNVIVSNCKNIQWCEDDNAYPKEFLLAVMKNKLKNLHSWVYCQPH